MDSLGSVDIWRGQKPPREGWLFFWNKSW